MADAWGTPLNIRQVPRTGHDGYVPHVYTGTPDGRFVVGNLVSLDEGMSEENGPSRPQKVVLIDVNNLQSIEMRTLPNKRDQAYGTSADDNWVVWAEAPQQPGFFSDWVIYAFNQTTRELKEVAKAPRYKDDMPILGGDGTPRVDRGIVVWMEASADTGGPSKPLIKSMELETGKVQTLTDNGVSPTISWPYVAWAEIEEEPSTQIENTKKRSIVVLDLQTGDRRTLKGPDTPASFALHKKALVWISAQLKEVYLTDIDDTQQQLLFRARHEDGDWFQMPTIGERLVSWVSSDSRAQVWDRAQNRLVVLEDEPGLRFVKNNTLIWVSPSAGHDRSTPGPDLTRTINVLDTSTHTK